MQALDFHHVASELKEHEIAGMKNRSFERLKPELDKCILLCANCHREFHACGGKFQDGTVPESLLNTI